MLTDEQMEKAKKALLDHKMRELAKRCLLRMYREEQARAERWQLPFRMVHKHEYLPGEIKPNDYYPHPSGVLKDADGTLSSVPESERITPDTARYYFTRILALNIDSYGCTKIQTGQVKQSAQPRPRRLKQSISAV